MKISKADKQQNIATLYGWSFYQRFGDHQQHPVTLKPMACLTRGKDEIVYLDYSSTLSKWVRALSVPYGSAQPPKPELFIPDLWSRAMISKYKKGLVLASLASPAVNSTRHAPATCRVRIHPHIGIPK